MDKFIYKIHKVENINHRSCMVQSESKSKSIVILFI